MISAASARDINQIGAPHPSIGEPSESFAVIRERPIRIKMRNTQHEQMSSASPPVNGHHQARKGGRKGDKRGQSMK